MRSIARTLALRTHVNLRLFAVCFLALAVSFPIAWISLAKLGLFVVCMFEIILRNLSRQHLQNSASLLTTKIVLLALGWAAISLLWSIADQSIAFMSFVKHSKLLGIVVIVMLLRTLEEARLAIAAFVIGQLFLLGSSIGLALGMTFPWVPEPWAPYFRGTNVVFSSYLDQSIMFATSAAIYWYLKYKHTCAKWSGTALAIASSSSALLLLEGRTAYVISVAMLSMAAMWHLPRRLQWFSLMVLPLVFTIGLYSSSSQFHARVDQIVSGAQVYKDDDQKLTSEGWRLHAWQRSLQAIAEKPLKGHGVGSWTPAIRALEGESYVKNFGNASSSNPHQEFLLWGVEMGLVGMALLVALMCAVAMDARHFPVETSRMTWSVVLAVLIACLFNSSLYDDLIGDYFCVALGLCLALGNHSRENVSVGHPVNS